MRLTRGFGGDALTMLPQVGADVINDFAVREELVRTASGETAPALDVNGGADLGGATNG